MVTIGINQLFSNSSVYEHRCLGKIKKLYKNADKYNYQQQYKAIIEAAMVSTNEIGTGNSLMSPSQSVTVKNPIARKSLRQFLEALDVKYKTAVCRLGAAKSKCKAIIAGNTLWSILSKNRGHTKINQ